MESPLVILETINLIFGDKKNCESLVFVILYNVFEPGDFWAIIFGVSKSDRGTTKNVKSGFLVAQIICQ
jgi:hypothetical protein